MNFCRGPRWAVKGKGWDRREKVFLDKNVATAR